MASQITVLVHYERISLFHTMEPFFLKQFRTRFFFTQSLDYCLNRDRNAVLVMERWFKDKDSSPPDLEQLKKLKSKYKTVFLMDGYAAAGTHLLETLPYVDALFHKSVFSDFDNYKKELYAKRLFAHYYHQKYGVTDSAPEYAYQPGPETLKALEKTPPVLRLSWNIGLGDYPRRNTPQRLGVILARLGLPGLGRCLRARGRRERPDFSSDKRTIKIHARIEPVTSESVAFQRRLFIDKIKDDPRFTKGWVPQNLYYRELEDSQIVFSPFGWGEVCFRDFEAIVSGALLLKPDMSHLSTWPDVYLPGETYVPVSWDGEDLFDKADYYLSHPAERRRIASNAFEHYQNQLRCLKDRFAELFASILN